jgi:hypothetical protein
MGSNVGGVIPREGVYGDTPNELRPLGDYADKLIDPRDYKERIAWAHEQKILPMYHQSATWAPDGFRWSQNGLNYCWAWSMTAALMDAEAREGKPVVLLSPVTMGWTVGWRNAGNYLTDAIKAATQRGIAPMEFTPNQHSRSPSTFKAGWEEAAMQHRLGDGEVWDMGPRNMIQHCVSVLCSGVSVYIAYFWWSHALELIGLVWDESVPNNLRWIIRNSHNEPEPIELTGSRAIPDEAFGIRASLVSMDLNGDRRIA